MLKWLLSSILFIAPLFSMTQAGPQIDLNENQFEDEDDIYWTGPGWYWGIYIPNEHDYWHHHNLRYPDHDSHDDHASGE